MLSNFRSKKNIQLAMGFLLGIAFGFSLQKGGVTQYDVIIRQLLLEDFTVLKVMLTAVVTGMVGIYLMRGAGMVELHPKAGSFGATAIGGIIFGVGFAILGYCPGTMAGAVGQGSLDALCGGVPGMLAGAWLFAVAYPALERRVLRFGDFGDITIPQLLGLNPWVIIIPLSAGIAALLFFLESAGL